MAVNSIIFGGVNSADYGIYISGEGVFNAPKRDVEMINIPGRNGEFALDKGRFDNIEVAYPAFNFEPNDYASFAQNLADFRNAISSLRGYQRLTDTFHPNEYRIAVFVDGLEIEPIKYNTASEFDITFDCKPQRWLTSGETKSSVASGGTVTNPTLFDASPLIECKGYGNINLNGGTITIAPVPIGNVLLSNGASFNKSNMSYSALAEQTRVTIDASKLNTGDSIYTAASDVTYNLTVEPVVTLSSISVENPVGDWETSCAISSSTTAYCRTTIPAQTFQKGTSGTKSYEYWMHWEADAGSVTASRRISIQLSYDGANTIKLSVTQLDTALAYETYSMSGRIGQVNGYSTIVVDQTFYIDLEIGEAYYLSNNTYSSANYAVTIPAKLPTLAPGANTITYTNTITNFKITPRWWKV